MSRVARAQEESRRRRDDLVKHQKQGCHFGKKPPVIVEGLVVDHALDRLALAAGGREVLQACFRSELQ